MDNKEIKKEEINVEKEIKTYGDLACELLKYHSKIGFLLTHIKIETLKLYKREYNHLIEKYGEDNLIHVKNLLFDLSFYAKRLSEESKLLNEDYFVPSGALYMIDRGFNIKTIIEKINEIKAELDKEIEC